jgi:hypothetical protein
MIEAHIAAAMRGRAAKIAAADFRADWGIGALVRRRLGPIDHGVDVGGLRCGAGIGDRAEQAMAEHTAGFEVLGPWSLETGRGFWEGFPPAALAGQLAGPGLCTVFCAEGDWRRAEVEVTQAGDRVHKVVTGDGRHVQDWWC